MLAKIDGQSFEPANEIHSLDPWWIARYMQQLERTAMHSLIRSGFECYTPTYKNVRQLPLRKIPPKQRRNAARFIEQVRKKRFPGYMLIRQVSGHFDINRLFDLHGCGGIVSVSGKPALIANHDVELMRLAETDGKFDVYHVRGLAIGLYKVGWLDGDADLKKQWDSIAPMKRPLDDSGTLSLTVDAFGRVSHFIANADPI